MRVKMQIKQYLKIIASYILLFFIMIGIFCFLMIMTYALPNERIQGHIAESKTALTRAIGNPFFEEYVKGGQLDEFTDLIIMNTAMNKGKSEDDNIIVRAFENSRYSGEGLNQYDSMIETIDNPDLYNNSNYPRYWHGIQTIVRPLLLFFNYEEIRFLYMLVMFMLLTGVTLMLYKNLSIWHALSFMFSMLAINFFIIPMSLQYTSVFAIMLVTVIIINILYKKNKEKWLPYLFFIIGGCTTFFDLLTAPIITLGIPLLMVLLLKNKENYTIKQSIIEIIKLSILWAISYGLTFLTKWIIASVVLQQDLITEAINQILFRTNGSEEYPATKIGAIIENIKYLYNTVLLLSGAIIGIIWIIALIKKRKSLKDIKFVIPLIIVALFPYIWYAAIAGHSTIHAFFTYRIQAIAIFGILCAMIECIQLEKLQN